MAWEFPLGALRWSRKSQMPCERGICEDRRSHDVRRDTPLPATGRPLSGTLLHAATSRLRVPWACVGFGTVVPQVVCRDMPLPASGVAAVGHKITECSSMEILGRGLTMTTGPPSSTTLTKFAMLRDATAGTWFEDCGTHAQTSCWSSLATESVSCQLGNLKFDDVLNDLLGKEQAQTQRGNRHASRPLVVGKQWFIEGSILFRSQRSAARTSSFAVACREFENSKPSTVDVGALAR